MPSPQGQPYPGGTHCNPQRATAALRGIYPERWASGSQWKEGALFGEGGGVVQSGLWWCVHTGTLPDWRLRSSPLEQAELQILLASLRMEACSSYTFKNRNHSSNQEWWPYVHVWNQFPFSQVDRTWGSECWLLVLIASDEVLVVF